MWILDVGCGSGLLLRHAAALFPGAVRVGVDLSRAMLQIARAGTGLAGLVRPATPPVRTMSGHDHRPRAQCWLSFDGHQRRNE